MQGCKIWFRYIKLAYLVSKIKIIFYSLNVKTIAVWCGKLFEWKFLLDEKTSFPKMYCVKHGKKTKKKSKTKRKNYPYYLN